MADRVSAQAPRILTCLWELSDGTRAVLLEYSHQPRSELRTVRRDCVVQQFRCDAIGDLMVRSLAEYQAASGTLSTPQG
jgi:hypothetical protein